MNVSWSFDPSKYPQTACPGLLHDPLHLRIGSQEVGKSFSLVGSVRQESTADLPPYRGIDSFNCGAYAPFTDIPKTMTITIFLARWWFLSIFKHRNTFFENSPFVDRAPASQTILLKIIANITIFLGNQIMAIVFLRV